MPKTLDGAMTYLATYRAGVSVLTTTYDAVTGNPSTTSEQYTAEGAIELGKELIRLGQEQIERFGPTLG